MIAGYVLLLFVCVHVNRYFIQQYSNMEWSAIMHSNEIITFSVGPVLGYKVLLFCLLVCLLAYGYDIVWSSLPDGNTKGEVCHLGQHLVCMLSASVAQSFFDDSATHYVLTSVEDSMFSHRLVRHTAASIGRQTMLQSLLFVFDFILLQAVHFSSRECTSINWSHIIKSRETIF